MDYEEIKAGLDKYMAGVEAKLNKPKLKPCPFCGGEAEVECWMGRKGWLASVSCGQCDVVMGGGIYCDSRKEAITKVIKEWNTRHEPPTPGGAIVPAENERLR